MRLGLYHWACFVGDVGGRDEAVGDVGVDAVCRDRDVEGLLTLPLTVVLDEDLDADGAVSSEGALHHLMPALQPRAHVLAAKRPFLTAGSEAGDKVGGFSTMVDVEVERRDVHGHGDADVIGVNGGGCVSLNELLGDGGGGAGAKNKDPPPNPSLEGEEKLARWYESTQKRMNINHILLDNARGLTPSLREGDGGGSLICLLIPD